ncbi:MAG: hypothetical protein JXR96_27335 [Deltaproteobacteria bacterium]|nr:hypothetical protein [Deltaproteobacteria bacterium]
MPERFRIHIPVTYRDVDRHLELCPLALLGAMQEAAILQSESLGRGMRYLEERGWGWLIVHTRLRILRPIRWGASLEVATWPSALRRLLSRREFVACDRDGDAARASTLWAFVDRSAGRVQRIPEELAAAYPVDRDQALPGAFRRPVRPAGELLAERCTGVRPRDIDSNGHVNNLRYLDWMIDTLPEIDSLQLGSLQVRYLAETPPGCRVHVRTWACGPEHFHHEIQVEDGVIAAVARTRWQRRDQRSLRD